MVDIGVCAGLPMKFGGAYIRGGYLDGIKDSTTQNKLRSGASELPKNLLAR